MVASSTACACCTAIKSAGSVRAFGPHRVAVIVVDVLEAVHIQDRKAVHMLQIRQEFLKVNAGIRPRQ